MQKEHQLDQESANYYFRDQSPPGLVATQNRHSVYLFSPVNGLIQAVQDIESIGQRRKGIGYPGRKEEIYGG